MHIIIWTIQILIIPMLSPLGVGIVKKIKARLQNFKIQTSNFNFQFQISKFQIKKE